MIVTPLIRSLWSLEAAHANASDVFIFWHAAAGVLYDLFSQSSEKTGIAPDVSKAVSGLYNKRFEALFNNEVYFTAFVLDPRYDFQRFLKKTTVKLSISKSGAPTTSQTISSATSLQFSDAYSRVKACLKDILKEMLMRMDKYPEELPVALKRLKTADIVSLFISQLTAYWKNEHPFVGKKTDHDDPLKWWKTMQHHPSSNVLALLAIKIFSILINSMPDERTNSNITWFNSPLRGNLTVESEGYNYLWVVICRMTSMVHLLPWTPKFHY